LSQIVTDVDHGQDLILAKDIAETLNEHYPGHLWAVNVNSGVAIIKNLYISSAWGFVLHYNNIKGDAGYRKKRVIQAGGELLERANMKRGKYEGFEVKKVDGIR